MRIERVLAKNLGEVRHGLAIDQDIAQREVNGKVEGRVEPGIDSVVRNPSCKKRSGLGIAIEDLSYGCQVRIGGVQSGMKVMPEGAVHVGKCIQANAIEVGRLNPPHRVLDQVARYQGIFLVQVGHGVGEPAVGDGSPGLARGMRVYKLIEVVLRGEMILE